jgi:hypothetical protein
MFPFVTKHDRYEIVIDFSIGESPISASESVVMLSANGDVQSGSAKLQPIVVMSTNTTPSSFTCAGVGIQMTCPNVDYLISATFSGIWNQQSGVNF